MSIPLALRNLGRTPRFTLMATATLAVGIGLATAVFTTANTLLIRRLPVTDQDRLITLWGQTPDQKFKNYPFDLATSRIFATQTKTLQQVAAFDYNGANAAPFRDGDLVSPLRLVVVSGNFFEALGSRPLIGRLLQPADDVIGAAPVAVLSESVWRGRFGADPAVIGRELELHATRMKFRIVGVMQGGLDFPAGSEIWAPIMPARTFNGQTFADVDLVARLNPGATPADATAELDAFYKSRPENPLTAVVTALPRLILGDVRPALLAFSAAAALLLLITCINVANLLLLRGLTRVREFAVRVALGAGRGQLVRQLLTENGLLALLGGALAIPVAAGALKVVTAFAPTGLPRLDEIRLDLVVLAGAMGIAGFAMLVFGVIPAVFASRVDPERTLRSDTRQTGSGASRLVSQGLVALQMTLAVLVLSAAGLIARSLVALESADLAFEPSRLAIAQLAVRADQSNGLARQIALLDGVVERVSGVPGVEVVSPVVAHPYSGSGGWDGRPVAVGQTPDEARSNPMLNMDVVTPEYFRAFDIPVLAGRGLTPADRPGAERVVVLSASAARHYSPGGNALGQRLTLGEGSPDTVTVVGVVADTRYRDLREARASIYFPLAQSPFPFAPTTLAIRTTGDPASILAAIREAVARDPAVVVVEAAPFSSYLDKPLGQPRFNAVLLGGFAGAAVLLAAIGLFGIMATMVRQRTREIGIRMALGATTHELRAMVLRRGIAITALGMTIGVGAALFANRLLASLLYEVRPADGVTLAGVVALLTGVAILASTVPAHASTRVDPVTALRAEG